MADWCVAWERKIPAIGVKTLVNLLRQHTRHVKPRLDSSVVNLV